MIHINNICQQQSCNLKHTIRAGSFLQKTASRGMGIHCLLLAGMVLACHGLGMCYLDAVFCCMPWELHKLVLQRSMANQQAPMPIFISMTSPWQKQQWGIYIYIYVYIHKYKIYTQIYRYVDIYHIYEIVFVHILDK